MGKQKLKTTFIDNLDIFYSPYQEDKFPPLFHGTRRYSIDCDPSLIDEMRKHCTIVLEKARDYYNTLDYEQLAKYEEYAHSNRISFFACYLVQDFGRYKNYEYNDFFMTCRFDKTYLYPFTKYGCGELGEFAYQNIIGLKHFNIDLGIDESIEFILKHYPLFKNSEPVILIVKDLSYSDLKSENGTRTPKNYIMPNYRLINPEEKEFFVIKEELFKEAEELFDMEIRDILIPKLSDEEIKIGRGWLHDVLYMGGLIEYKRTVPLEEYRYIYTDFKIDKDGKYASACKVICDIFLKEKISYDDLEAIDSAILIFNKRPFGGKLKETREVEFKTNYELSKYLSRLVLTTKNFNIKIDEDVFTIGKRKSIFAKALYYDRYNY